MPKKTPLTVAGLKNTVPRLKILRLLEENKHKHFSAEDIYRDLLNNGEDIALATVYRVLTQFESADLILKHQFDGEQSTFELNNGEHHDHLVCIQCGRVEEFKDEIIEQRQDAISKIHAFKMTDHSLNIYGLCPKCQT